MIRRRVNNKGVIEEKDWYLKFTALEPGTFSFTIPASITSTQVTSVDYSLDGGRTWITTINDNTDISITTPTIVEGDFVLWRGIAPQRYGSYVNSINQVTTPTCTGSHFSSTGQFTVSGNILCLLYGKDYRQYCELREYNGVFKDLFWECDGLVSAENLNLTTAPIQTGCYQNLFYKCTSLTIPCELPATSGNGQYAYARMFSYCPIVNAPEIKLTVVPLGLCARMFTNCTQLQYSPDLSAVTVGQNGYYHMFYGCTSLEVAPNIECTSAPNSNTFSRMFANCTSLISGPSELKPPTLGSSACEYMFDGCSSLINPPKLSATTITYQTYWFMFQNCTSLVTAPTLTDLKTINSLNSTGKACYAMFYGCTKLENGPVRLKPLTIGLTTYQYMFNNCQKLKYCPEIYATTVGTSSCQQMFNGCKQLTSSSTLFTKTLANYSYSNMFNGCTNLNKVISLNTSTPGSGTSGTGNWLKSVASTGTFYKASDATWNTTITRSENTVPSNWTISNAALYIWINDSEENPINGSIENYITDPETNGCTLYKYTGNTINFNSQTCYVWENEQQTEYLLTTTLDYTDLISQSLAYDEISNFSSFVCITRDQTTVYKDTNIQLIKLFADEI